MKDKVKFIKFYDIIKSETSTLDKLCNDIETYNKSLRNGKAIRDEKGDIYYLDFSHLDKIGTQSFLIRLGKLMDSKPDERDENTNILYPSSVPLERKPELYTFAKFYWEKSKLLLLSTKDVTFKGQKILTLMKATLQPDRTLFSDLSIKETISKDSFQKILEHREVIEFCVSLRNPSGLSLSSRFSDYGKSENLFKSAEFKSKKLNYSTSNTGQMNQLKNILLEYLDCGQEIESLSVSVKGHDKKVKKIYLSDMQYSDCYTIKINDDGGYEKESVLEAFSKALIKYES